MAQIAGVELEDSGLALSIHYHHVELGLQHAVEQIVDDYVAYHPSLTKTMGKMVLNCNLGLIGRAVMYILSELGLDAEDVVPFYLGDNVSDEDAFQRIE
ncbi:unnamed protein product [Peronospora destructor]|uniref:Uncharacterized protein n=1 Tax=Peronospora destructor TaxID=86335 RepID=A0AAV0V2B0_9STRA|nr:unnamed protein product [Peronospora destructor]